MSHESVCTSDEFICLSLFRSSFSWMPRNLSHGMLSIKRLLPLSMDEPKLCIMWQKSLRLD